MKDPFGAKESILVVASDPLMRSILCETLDGAGYLVVSAEDLGDAVNRMNEMTPDLLMIRPYIESMGGDEAADYLRRKHPGLPVLMVTGFLDDDRIRTWKDVEQFHVFPKPYTAKELLSEVKEVLRAPENRRRKGRQ